MGILPMNMEGIPYFGINPENSERYLNRYDAVVERYETEKRENVDKINEKKLVEALKNILEEATLSGYHSDILVVSTRLRELEPHRSEWALRQKASLNALLDIGMFDRIDEVFFERVDRAHRNLEKLYLMECPMGLFSRWKLKRVHRLEEKIWIQERQAIRCAIIKDGKEKPEEYLRWSKKQKNAENRLNRLIRKKARYDAWVNNIRWGEVRSEENIVRKKICAEEYEKAQNASARYGRWEKKYYLKDSQSMVKKILDTSADEDTASVNGDCIKSDKLAVKQETSVREKKQQPAQAFSKRMPKRVMETQIQDDRKISDEKQKINVFPMMSETVYYQTEPGDTLPLIAQKLLGNETRWREIYEINRNRLKKGLFAGGQWLEVSVPRMPPGQKKIMETPVRSRRYYLVQKSDTLPSIARAFYGTEERWKKIYDENRSGISKGLPRPGAVLVIP